jgi:G patch domain-containing protein 1
MSLTSCCLGWAPSTFKSTRKVTDDGDADINRRLQPQSIHDFMDEEDMAESGFAPKQVRATGEFKEDEDTSAKRKATTSEESKALQYLETLVQPSSENVGRRLLQLMGWREGQGIGPRIPARRQTPGYVRCLRRVAHAVVDPCPYCG